MRGRIDNVEGQDGLAGQTVNRFGTILNVPHDDKTVGYEVPHVDEGMQGPTKVTTTVLVGIPPQGTHEERI